MIPILPLQNVICSNRALTLTWIDVQRCLQISFGMFMIRKRSIKFFHEFFWAMVISDLIFFLHFHRNRMVSLSLLEFKQLMLILCNTQNFEQLTMEEFNLAADHNRCVNRFRLESIIKVIAKFFVYLEESTTFYRTQSITAMIKECFEQVNVYMAMNYNYFPKKQASFPCNHSIFSTIFMFPVSWHNWFDWIAIYWPLAKTTYCFFTLFKCAGISLSH